MTLTFSGTISGALDRACVLPAVAALADLVADPAVAGAWSSESSLPGMSVGGVTRHLVSQPECAAEFLTITGPPMTSPLPLLEYAASWDWLDAARDAPENTSIRDDFDAMAAAGPEESIEVLSRSLAALPGALDAAGTVTFVPWQGVWLDTDDFLVVRLMEMVVHADDLAVSVGRRSPDFADEVLDPVLRLLAALSVRRHGTTPLLRALSRGERCGSTVSAFAD